MKYLLIALLAASTAAHAQEYVFKDQPFESGYLSTDGKTFSINTVNSSGNLCNLEGRLNNNVYRDGEGCEVRFTFARNKVNVTVKPVRNIADSTHILWINTTACPPPAPSLPPKTPHSAFRLPTVPKITPKPRESSSSM